MTTQQNTVPSYTPEEIATCRNSTLFSLKALGLSALLLTFTDEEMADAMENDELLLMYIQILKMQAIDKNLEEMRAKMREDLISKISQGLVVRNHPNTKALVQSPVDYDALPEMPGFSAQHINSVKPVRAENTWIH